MGAGKGCAGENHIQRRGVRQGGGELFGFSDRDGVEIERGGREGNPRIGGERPRRENQRGGEKLR